jgi:RNA polymerase sigma-70 factor, ECF subfamily
LVRFHTPLLSECIRCDPSGCDPVAKVFEASLEAGVTKQNNATGFHTGRSYIPSVELRVSTGDDEADVQRVLTGDISAFENIVRRWQGPLVNLAYRFCRDHGRAEEMAQDAFLRVYRGLGQWRRDAAFSTWLFAVATNLYRSELRRIPARVVPIDDAIGANISDQGESLTELDRGDAIRKAVLALPAKYREAIILFYFHEMDVAAAARSLGLPEGTVKARLSRGRDILRKKFRRRFETSRWEKA